jgi:hypothetical protein
MSLESWLKNGWLKRHPPDRREIGDLLGVAARDLRDCKAKGLSDDWRFNIAYNAALQSAFAALYATGHAVPKGDSHHFRVIQSLQWTIGLPIDEVDRFEAYRKKRNMGIYDVAGVISGADADECVAFATTLAAKVREWLEDHHPELL